MQNPEIQFPYVTEAYGLLVYSGVFPIVKDDESVGWMVIAVSSNHKRPLYTSQGGMTFKQAVDCAQNEAPGWFRHASPESEAA